MFDCCLLLLFFFFFKQKTAYEMRISDWSSDVCSSDLGVIAERAPVFHRNRPAVVWPAEDKRIVRHDEHVREPTWIRVFPAPSYSEIGRASCRERVCQYV